VILAPATAAGDLEPRGILIDRITLGD